MKKLTIAILLMMAVSAQANDEEGDVPFMSKLFLEKCAMLNDDLEELNDSYKTHVEGMLAGFLSAYSSIIYSDKERYSMYIPSVEGTHSLYTQVVFKHCRDNPADIVFAAATKGMSILPKERSE